MFVSQYSAQLILDTTDRQMSYFRAGRLRPAAWMNSWLNGLISLHVGNQHLCTENLPWPVRTGDTNVSAVHVELTISNRIDPTPSKCASFTTGQVFWELYWPHVALYRLNNDERFSLQEKSCTTYLADNLPESLQSHKTFDHCRRTGRIGRSPKHVHIHFMNPPCTRIPLRVWLILQRQHLPYLRLEWFEPQGLVVFPCTWPTTAKV